MSKQEPFAGTQKKTTFLKKLRKENLLDNNDLLAPKAPYFKADFAEGEILPQQIPARELRAHLLRGSSLVIAVHVDLEFNLFGIINE